uniref:Cytochrome b561 domain-containing protein n=1 Tax=Haemonchus placei TaxID=6290 RepID=A0A0N4WQ85_HAEPC
LQQSYCTRCVRTRIWDTRPNFFVFSFSQKAHTFYLNRIVTLILGYLFNTMDHGIGWPQKGNDRGLNFHGILMSTGLIFFQGEALLSYRMYRSDSKIVSKTIHFVFHLLAISFFTTAFAAIIIQKNANTYSRIWKHFLPKKGLPNRTRVVCRKSNTIYLSNQVTQV